MADNVAVTAGTGTTIAADEVTDGTLGTVKVGYIKIMDGTLDGTTKAAVGANGLEVDVKAAVITSGTITTVSAVTAISNALPAGSNVIGHVIADTGSTTAVTGNVTAVQATGTNLHTVVDSGTITTVSTVTAVTAITNALPAGSNVIGHVIADTGSTTAVTGTVTTTAVGTIADDATTPGAPVMVGGSAKSFDGTDPGSVSAENDVTRCITDMNRRLYVNGVHPNNWDYHNDGSSALSAASVQSAPGAGFALYVTDICFSTGAATACNILLKDGDGTTIWGPKYLEATAGRGLIQSFTKPLRVTTNKALTVTTSAAIAQSTDISGFIAAV